MMLMTVVAPLFVFRRRQSQQEANDGQSRVTLFSKDIHCRSSYCSDSKQHSSGQPR